MLLRSRRSATGAARGVGEALVPGGGVCQVGRRREGWVRTVGWTRLLRSGRERPFALLLHTVSAGGRCRDFLAGTARAGKVIRVQVLRRRWLHRVRQLLGGGFEGRGVDGGKGSIAYSMMVVALGTGIRRCASPGGGRRLTWGRQAVRSIARPAHRLQRRTAGEKGRLRWIWTCHWGSLSGHVLLALVLAFGEGGSAGQFDLGGEQMLRDGRCEGSRARVQDRARWRAGGIGGRRCDVGSRLWRGDGLRKTLRSTSHGSASRGYMRQQRRRQREM